MIKNVNTERPGIFSLVERKKWDAWKEVEGLSADQAKQQYIEALLEMFDHIGEQVNISDWLSGDANGALIKEKLALLGKVV
uniref:ACB domain-containing protein n=1 Tax=Acrobeloides nanus TaxID=290746 RepID=A0A914CJX8_9BILA